MEENKTIKMEPKNEEAKQVVKEPKQPTYEELTNGLNRAYQENQYLRNELTKAYNALNQLQVDNGFKRLDCLFKSLEYAHYFDDEYINDVIKEIKEMIIINDTEGVSEDTAEKEEPTDETVDQ